jgi:hypothetical protein
MMAANRTDNRVASGSGIDEGRRRLLKAMGLAAGGMAASALVPDKWVKPGVSVGTLPALAQTSVVLGTGDLQVTVTWDTDCTDIDTYVQEPDGNWVWYGDPIGTTATLDLDDTYGFGPENVFVGPGGSAAGTYKAYVGYYDWDCDTQGPPPTVVTIRITVFDGTPAVKQQTFTRNLTVADYNETLFEVAWIEFPAGTITEKNGTILGPAAASGVRK